MNIMNSHNKKYVQKAVTLCCGFAAVLTGMTSCSDFLEIKPQSEIILEDFWNEKADVDNIVAGCYSALQSDDVRRRMMVWGEFRSDNIMSGQNINSDVNLYNVLQENITAMNSYTTWDGFYTVINRCNTVLKYAPGVAAIDPAFTQGDLKATIAEVTALRSLCYFYLIRTFRDVPFSREAFTDDDQRMDLPAMPFYEVLDNLIADLESVKDDAVSRYPETKPKYQTGRITKTAIHAMLCEMYLWKKDYDNCIHYADLVIQAMKDLDEENEKKNGGRSLTTEAALERRLNGFPLVPDNLQASSVTFGTPYRTIFVNGSSKETIFELAYDENPVGNGMTANTAISKFYGNATAQKGLVAASSAVTDDITATSGRSIFEDKNKKLDARLYQNCLTDGGNIVKMACPSLTIDARTANEPQLSGKPSYFGEKDNSTQWIIYRLPDIMLLKAEALCQKMMEGSDEATVEFNRPMLEEAFRMVNVVNKRSICKAVLEDADTLKLSEYSTKNSMEGLVMRERQRELMFEGKRYYDLVRYAMRSNNTDGIISASTKRDDVNKQFAQNFFKKMDAIFWPYNIEEMKVNRNLVPNPAFSSGESESYEKTN